MNEEMLIEEVRKYPCLYDMADQKYMDTKYKSQLWIKIGKRCNRSELYVKKRWSNIRDQYRRSLAKLKTSSGQGVAVVKNYKYSEQLQFLKPYFVDRETITNIGGDTDSSTALEPEEMETPCDGVPISSGSRALELSMPFQQQAGPSSAPQLGPDLESEHGTPPEQFRVPTRGNRMNSRARRTRPAAAQYHTSHELFQLIKNREQRQPDDIDHFCNSLASTMRTFPPFLRNKAKGRLFQVIQEIELEHILDNMSSPIPDPDHADLLNSSAIATSQECLAGSPTRHSAEGGVEEIFSDEPVNPTSESSSVVDE